MKRKLFSGALILVLAVMALGASRQSSEYRRMGIFLSNFTEAGLYNFDLEEGDMDSILHFGNNPNSAELIRFGIIHNVINNPKTTIKRCPDRHCEYGRDIISGASVAASVRKYFDLRINNHTFSGSDTFDGPDAEVYYDGRNYHINAADWRPETVYYAEVQEVSSSRGIITMTGELYNLRDKQDRPGTFTATASPHVWDDKDTWAILSLYTEWR